MNHTRGHDNKTRAIQPRQAPWTQGIPRVPSFPTPYTLAAKASMERTTRDHHWNRATQLQCHRLVRHRRMQPTPMPVKGSMKTQIRSIPVQPMATSRQRLQERPWNNELYLKTTHPTPNTKAHLKSVHMKTSGLAYNRETRNQ